jgi:hypothetical protein
VVYPVKPIYAINAKLQLQYAIQGRINFRSPRIYSTHAKGWHTKKFYMELESNLVMTKLKYNVYSLFELKDMLIYFSSTRVL